MHVRLYMCMTVPTCRIYESLMADVMAHTLCQQTAAKILLSYFCLHNQNIREYFPGLP